ncbi:MAG: hypothetical protein U1E47_05395 [Rivihabitans pingtungensis]
MLTSATAAYDNVTRTAKKVGTELAEAGVEAAANSAKAASAVAAHHRCCQEVIQAGPAESRLRRRFASAPHHDRTQNFAPWPRRWGFVFGVATKWRRANTPPLTEEAIPAPRAQRPGQNMSARHLPRRA